MAKAIMENVFSYISLLDVQEPTIISARDL